MASSIPCPSCTQPMETRRFSSRYGMPIDVDVCHSCHVLWFDHRESSQLSAHGVLELFEQIHVHRDETRLPLAATMRCPRCAITLKDGFDVVSSGRYITYRCSLKHGRLSTFSSFLTEKGFVRQMTPVEVREMAKRVAAIHCSSCGSPVDIRKDAACPFCRSPFSLLDPEAVENAVAKYKAALPSADPVTNAETLADGLISLERQREIAKRQMDKEKRERHRGNDLEDVVDLVESGVEMVWNVLFKR